ncbi:MAG: class I SAM-dependent methyltransferase [Chitinophagaceae bacterium]|nr:class I SAM-dependent methyltransferase [Chitinophagaceae bacterium]
MEALEKNSQAWYKDWFNSPYYHQLYFQRDEQEAADFIDALLMRLNPPADAQMLDVACGRGRHSIHLASKGFSVTGIDISEDSIEEAKEHENNQLEFFVHDMRLPFRMNYYQYAFNFFTSFGFFRTRREHDNAIRTIAQSLKQEGVFVIDYLNAHYVENHLLYKSELRKGDVSFYITRWLNETHFYKKIVVEDEANLEEPLEFTEKVAKFSLGDFNDMLAFHGLQIQEVYGSYQFEPYHVNNSPRLIIIAKKIN